MVTDLRCPAASACVGKDILLCPDHPNVCLTNKIHCVLQALSIVTRLRRPAVSERLAEYLRGVLVMYENQYKPAVWIGSMLPAVLCFLRDHMSVTMELIQGTAALTEHTKVRTVAG